MALKEAQKEGRKIELKRSAEVLRSLRRPSHLEIAPHHVFWSIGKGGTSVNRCFFTGVTYTVESFFT